MKQIPYQGKWAIVPTDNEIFFKLYSIDYTNNSHIKPAPRILPHLAEWLDATCPGRWTTTWVSSDGRLIPSTTQSILVDDEHIIQLFKLAWHDHPDIQRQIDLDTTHIYCPYIPLTVTIALPDDK